MAKIANKHPDNVPGKYYVDKEECQACDLCSQYAEKHFKMTEDGRCAYVYKQPENPTEEADCQNAKERCPAEAIGDDGQ